MEPVLAQKNTGTFNVSNKQQLLELLTQISRGTHDPTPTRRIHIDNNVAAETDEWWQNYFLSARKSYTDMANKAIKLLEET
jgi:lysophospholipase L1-like esterase